MRRAFREGGEHEDSFAVVSLSFCCFRVAVSQAPAVTGRPSVAAAANSLGQALGQALVRFLFSRPNPATPNAPQLDSAALAEAMRRAQFARDKNELMAALGMNGSNGATLNLAGSAPAQLQMEGPPASGDAAYGC